MWSTVDHALAFPVGGNVDHVILLGEYKATGIVIDTGAATNLVGRATLREWERVRLRKAPS